MLSSHNSNSSDAFLRPSFALIDNLRRYLWKIVWAVLCSWTPNPMHKWRIFILRIFGAKIGINNFIYPNCKIWAPWLLITHDVVTIGPNAEVYNPGGVRLGHHAILSQDSYLCGATHDYNTIDFTYVKKEIILEPYVWICAKAVVLPGVTCYEGSVLGAASVTSKNLESWKLYAGNPAMLIKERTRFLSEN